MDQRHIDATELEGIWFSGATVSGEEEAARQNILAHCQECSTCSELLNSYLVAEREIDSLKRRSEGGQKSNSNCPDEDVWLKLVADVLDQDEAIRLVAHASTCTSCARHLSKAQQYTSEEVAEAPERLSSSHEWQAEMAWRMAQHSAAVPIAKVKRRERALPGSWYFWGPFTAAASATVAIVVLLVTKSGPLAVENLLGEAYSQNRTVEPRFARAPYGKLAIERGPNSQSRTSNPPALLKAEESLARHLRTAPNDPEWLDLKGRADLLDGNYAEALKSLEQALQLQPDSVPVLTDTATAYFEIAEIGLTPQDYGKAIDLLSRALSKDPNDTVALYNRALVNEKMFLYPQAIADWQHYLQIDGHGEWAEDAKRHLDALQKKLADHQKNALEPLLLPSDFGSKPNAIGNDETRKLLDKRVEQYLDSAIRDWLPTAFLRERYGASGGFRGTTFVSLNGKSSSRIREALGAIKIFSCVLLTEHGDHWLTDLMGKSQSVPFPLAVHALREAVYANSVGEFASGRSKSREAARLFRQAGNVAGEMRAQYETAYAMERSFQEANRCVKFATSIGNQLRRHPYPWIQIQLDLTLSNCWSQRGNFDRAHRYIEEALASIAKSKYPALYLRSVGMEAALYSRRGNQEKAYYLDRSGLAYFWDGNLPPIRAYQFYSDLDTLAEERAEWNFALAIATEAVRQIKLAGQPLGEAFAHHRLAKIALMAGDGILAAREFDQANDLFAARPPTKETWAYEADANIELAKLQASHGNARDAWAHLAQAGNHISQTSHYSVALSYYQTKAALLRLDGERREAMESLRSAVAVAEKGLGSLSNEGDRLLWARETNQVYRDFAASLWREHDIAGSLGIWELYRGASVRSALGLQASSPRLDDLIALPVSLLMRPKPGRETQTTISYLQLPEGLIVWIFDEHNLTTEWIDISRESMSHLTRQFHDECADRSSNFEVLRQHSRELYDLLIAPIADHLPTSRMLVIEPDDSLQGIPMAALIDPAGRYLEENYTIVISPGVLYQLRFHAAQNVSSEDHALVVGSAMQDYRRPGTLSSPDSSGEEVRYVAGNFRVAKQLVGGQATVAEVLLELQQAAIFHYAGHGISVHGQIGLLLAPSYRDQSGLTAPVLDATSIMSAKLNNLKLAVFSACSTAGQGEDNLEGSSNLVRLFLRAGVPHVVASQWNVDSGATTDFMREFYNGLLAGGSVSFSLRAAAKNMARKQITSHPYYWAAFAVYGS